ncbi:MAG TPA: helix-turn-helix transcriptional regulator [Thermoanaerobaculia bacterium]|nr:helix-turn-helix transcriptional regulator [Thermoanaerobaculia bacterium]
MSDRDLRKGSAELLILALVEESDRHGYEIAKLIEERSQGAISFHVASLYPTLYRLERRGLLTGRWVERAGTRRRRFYHLTPAGQTVLDAERRSWRAFFAALERVARFRHA